MIEYWIFSTPLGDAALVTNKKGICQVLLPGWSPEKMTAFIGRHFPAAKPGPEPAPAEVRQAIGFVVKSLMGPAEKPGARLDLSGLTGFQKKVLAVTGRIRRGETRSYGEVAVEAGNPRAVRAAAQALAHNPVPLFIPCHRVIGKDGSLTGFSAPGGVNLKKYLLKLERARSK